MARGPDGQGVKAGFSLADELFNAVSLADLAREYSVVPGFDRDAFLARVVPGLQGRGLLERLDWITDCLEPFLPRDFHSMAEAVEAAMPPELDPSLKDNDFGRFIHAVPGILAVRHGMEDHRERALDLLYAATKRFSMEFYIRPFLNRWPDETLARLDLWCGDDNYHVRRLVSEGTRPRLPWAQNIRIDPHVPVRFLDRLHADPTRFVTRSVANHMNDLSKIDLDLVVGRLGAWAETGKQDPREMDWITRHALRTAVKRGEPAALALLGYRTDLDISADLRINAQSYRIGEVLEFEVTLSAHDRAPVIVDYRLHFARPNGRAEKVFKIKTVTLQPGKPVTLRKSHRLKGDATTFRLHPGPHAVTIQVNGSDVVDAPFALLPAEG